MSPKTQKYILNLDIAKDAKMLRERLNICGEALDYFYASSSILKAGTKAGLSLYEIAVMCCRNDNLGEVPSKLEALFGMAGDLAESAIRNDRWDSAVASRAIQEQLSPNGGSLLTPNLKNSFAKKAASAFDLTELARSKETSGVTTIPGMTQSAGSDESSYSDNVENDEDCEEWAAEIITAVTLDTSTRLMNVKSRSPSIDSDTSSEDGGFWHTSPNYQEDSWNEPVDDESNGDEESVSWSPSASPTMDVLGVSFMNAMHESRVNSTKFDMSYNPGDHARRTSFLQQEESTTEGLLIKPKPPPRTPSRVSFADINNIEFDRDNEDDKNHRTAQEINSINTAENHGIKPQMKRSRSYSALSSTVNDTRTSTKDDTKISSNRTSFTEDQYREYYLKFVDLVVVREITAAAAAANNSNS
jgi:hypothetical protein